jgi:hypothetical protein
LTSCSPCSEERAEPAVAPLELAYPVADSLVIEVQPSPPPGQQPSPPPGQQPSPLELLQALLPNLISVALLIALILYVGNAILEAVEEGHGG